MLSFDFLVIGSGIGGLGFALKVAEKATVAVICKGKATETNTILAQGGISAVTSPFDSAAQHVTDTLVAGAGHCNPETVQILAEKAPECIQELAELGVNFTRNPEGNLDLGREGGHHQNRIVHTHDHTGLNIQQVLLERAKNHPNISILENHFAVDLLLTEIQAGEKQCSGVLTYSAEKDTVFPIYAKSVMLASGGSGQVFQHTTNPAVATGDGVAMAYRAGAEIKDMEFVQFHPTALYDPGKPTFLISEAVRGFGAELKLADSTPFMHKYHEMGSLAPRDVVARAIHRKMLLTDSPCVYLDLRHGPEDAIREHFPKIFARCLESKVNMATDLIPVVPAAHYQCGGVVTDLDGRTNIPGLYACGEVACTGLHGANRLASNSLPEAWIFAGRAAEHALKSIAVSENPTKKAFPDSGEKISLNSYPAERIAETKEKVRQLMWTYAGIVRTTAGLLLCRQILEQILSGISQLQKHYAFSVELQELQNLTQVAFLITDAAAHASESKGCHYLEDSISNQTSQRFSGQSIREKA